ncbi:MAG: M23 family metallopeptidase [Deltaproteobacteria bacterium]|nr:M23 family metallopeptidase [Deltaproteobacteria bacterium]
MTLKLIKYAVLIFTLFSLFACGTGYGIYHKVAPGETFDSICQAYNMSRATVARMNGISDPSSVKPGDALYIPGASVRVDSTGIAAATEKPPNVKYDEVRRGEEIKKEPSAPKYEKRTKPLVVKKVSFRWPIEGEVISRFGKNGAELHDGIDIKGDSGHPVRASAAGRVIYSGNEIKGYGNMVIIKHEGRYSTVYAHNRSNAVIKGNFVKSGEVIAYVGESGKIGTAAVHFEIREGKVALDPLTLLP